MPPVTVIAIHDLAALASVLAALGITSENSAAVAPVIVAPKPEVAAAPAPKAEKPAKTPKADPKPEVVAETPKAEPVAEAPKAEVEEAPLVADKTAAEAVATLDGHANSPAPAATFEQVAAAITKLAKTDRTKAVALLAEFGAKRGQDLKPADFDTFLARATELTGA